MISVKPANSASPMTWSHSAPASSSDGSLLMTGPGEMVPVPWLTFELVPLGGFSTAANSAVPHNALHDARALRDHLVGLEP